MVQIFRPPLFYPILCRWVTKKNSSLTFLTSVTCLLTKTIGVQGFLVKEKEKRLQDYHNTTYLISTYKASFGVTKVGNFTTGVVKVTNFIFTQLYGEFSPSSSPSSHPPPPSLQAHIPASRAQIPVMRL